MAEGSRKRSPSARMKTSLIPPGLAVVSARMGRVGQSCAFADKVAADKVATKSKRTVAIERR
jgi:hypothetical protein